MMNLLETICLMGVGNADVLLRSGNGDETNIVLLIVLMVISAATLVLLAFKKKKK